VSQTSEFLQEPPVNPGQQTELLGSERLPHQNMKIKIFIKICFVFLNDSFTHASFQGLKKVIASLNVSPLEAELNTFEIKIESGASFTKLTCASDVTFGNFLL
jgi:hypothetical protein